MSLSITVNGERREVNSRTIQELLAELQLTERKVAVELNNQIVPRDSYQETLIQQEDRLEVVSFVGGG